MRKVLVCAILLLLAACCEVPDPEQYVASFYDALEQGEIDTALGYFYPEVTIAIDDPRFEDLPTEQYLVRLSAYLKDKQIERSEFTCTGNPVTFTEVLCAAGECERARVRFLLLSGKISDITVWPDP